MNRYGRKERGVVGWEAGFLEVWGNKGDVVGKGEKRCWEMMHASHRM